MRRTKADAEQTRNAILDAAEMLFFERGVEATALEHVAKAALVTRGAVYWHFKDKNDLLTALSQRFRPPQTEVVRLALANGHPDVLQLLETTGATVLAQFEAEESRQRLFAILTNYTARAQEHRCTEDMDMLLELTTAAKNAGQLAEDLTPRAAALALTVMMRGVLNEWLISGKSFSLSQEGVALLRRQIQTMRHAPLPQP